MLGSKKFEKIAFKTFNMYTVFFIFCQFVAFYIFFCFTVEIYFFTQITKIFSGMYSM